MIVDSFCFMVLQQMLRELQNRDGADSKKNFNVLGSKHYLRDCIADEALVRAD
jgi:hypothetical protein